MLGRTISHYEILEKLAEGGMGVVYKARDTHLDRFVAIKALPPELTGDPERKRRFVQEAKAASALNHPNIITIHDIWSDGGADFIVMEYVPGKTLYELVPREGMPVKEALKYAMQIADGLAKAHSAGIVHRDVKPSNIMVSEDGFVKLLDFGLAKLIEPPVAESDATDTVGPRTGEGKLPGTLAYMSPEQAEGWKLDARSDIFAFGALLYEMLTGRRAFQRESKVSTLSAIVREEPQPVSHVVEGLPVELEKLISRCLRKDRNRRIQHMGDVKLALEELQAEPAGRSAPSAGVVTPSIVVLPFVNLNRDEETDFFSDGLTEELINALAQVENVRVISRTSAFHFKGKTEDIRTVGQRLQVNTVLEGSVRRAGNRVRITAQLVSVADGSHLWSQRFDRELKDIFDVQDEVARAILDTLRVKLAGEPQLP